MKAVICTISGGVHIHTPGKDRWEVCQCGHTGARWEDPEAGKLIVACRARKDHVFGLGLNNQLLVRAITQPGRAWEDYRNWHDIATDAPGYVFDKSRAGCWAVVFRIGSTGDTRWATEAEYMECFPHNATEDEDAGRSLTSVIGAGLAAELNRYRGRWVAVVGQRVVSDGDSPEEAIANQPGAAAGPEGLDPLVFRVPKRALAAYPGIGQLGQPSPREFPPCP